MTSRTVALVPLRGGSKSIPGKNIRLLAGRPLCAWALSAAVACRRIDQVYVSTDSAEIAGVVQGLGLGVTVLDRPPELATDSASTESVMVDFAERVPFDTLVTIQATSPLTTTGDFEAALERFTAGGFDSLVTGVNVRRFFWSAQGTPVNYEPARRPRRQDFPGWTMENGAFYITRRTHLEQTGCRLGGRIAIHQMAEETQIEIDEPDDWFLIEALLHRRLRAAAVGGIRLLVLDVDGTLTDGGMYYSETGEALKRFDTRDGFGIRRLRESGVEVAICTGESTGFSNARAAKLGIATCLTGITDKVAAIRDLARSAGIPMQEVAFVGDDLNDLAALREAGFAACPADAAPAVRSVCHFVSSRSGGHGAVREICDHLLASGRVSGSGSGASA